MDKNLVQCFPNHGVDLPRIAETASLLTVKDAAAACATNSINVTRCEQARVNIGNDRVTKCSRSWNHAGP